MPDLAYSFDAPDDWILGFGDGDSHEWATMDAEVDNIKNIF